jgi:hypothetical protein
MIRQLIREMSVANPLWGAPRIHSELLKLGLDVGQTHRGEVHGEKTTAAVAGLEDLCSQSRRRHRVDRHLRGADDLVWASSHPAAVTPRASVAGCDSPSQWGMACPSTDRGLRLGQPPRYLIRDRDAAYGAAFIRRIRAMGIRDRPVSARSPWQNGYAERLIGSIRRECLDHVVVVGERHLRHVLALYQILQRGQNAPIVAEGRAASA